MCGIFGWWGKEDRKKLNVIANKLKHRGPDGEGYYHDDQVGLGMTRLAILDKQRGNQPVSSSDSSVIAICNGEIYNYREIKEDLEKVGYTFISDCDSEIIPAAYQQWGMKMLDRFNGMFAIALFDKLKNELFVARDRFGQKPIYYTEQSELFYFSSEVRGLSALGIKKAVNVSAIKDYLRLRYVPEPETMFDGIQLIPAGCYWSSKERGIKQWWNLDDIQKNSANLEELSSLTNSAVQLALISDEPITIHLSAGVDSSLLLAEAVRQEVNVSCITAGFGSESDEVREAGRFAEKLGVKHYEAKLTAESLSELPRVIEQMEVPVGDALIIAFDLLAKTTKSIGAKVALGGEGVDEAFGGYSFHKVMLTAEKLGKLGRMTAAKVLTVLPNFLINKISAFPADIGQSGLDKVVLYLREYDKLTDLEKGIKLRTLFDESGIESRTLPAGDFLLDKHLKFQFKSWMQDWSIIRQERNSMAHSIEYRMPFLDHRIVEFGLGTERSMKFNGRTDKTIWRQLAANKYPEISSSRSKQPFYFPMEDPAYFEAFEELWNTYLEGDKVLIKEFDTGVDYESLKYKIDQHREFLPIKQAMALIILEIWLNQHFG